MRIRDLFSEKYTPGNTYLHKYLANEDSFDPRSYWHLVWQWLKENNSLDELADILGVEDAGSLNEEEVDPEVFAQFPNDWKSKIESYVYDYLGRHDPAELPSTYYLNAKDKRLLPAQTWLVHFTDHADDIVERGFQYGVDDMTRLGLTTYVSKSAKDMGGYNFAFIADDRDASRAARNRKYGKDAIMFQNSGVRAYHNCDEEEQIIFVGADVDPRMIIELRHRDDWMVIGRRANRRQEYTLFSGDFDACVTWVMSHYQTYRKKLFAR